MKKKFVLLFLAVILAFTFCGCKNKQQNPLYQKVSHLRQQLYQGSDQDFIVKAVYGFREVEPINDAKVNDKAYYLTFRLLDKELEQITYTLTFDFNGKTYQDTFKLNPVADCITAEIQVDNFNQESFSVCISYGENNKVITMNSIVPKGVISYQKALDCLYEKQRPLVDAYTDNQGNFNAELFVKIIVKDSKPFWYVAIASGNNNLKALLIDGFSGEILAVRQIF